MIIFNLDKLLIDRKMQSLELAEKLDCTVQTVSRIKTGKIKSLRMGMLDDLCVYFDCQPGDILEYVSEEDAASRFGDAFVEEYRRSHR